MTLQQLANKLRKIANDIDSLFIDITNENEVTAKKILNKKIHWTQTASGKKRLAEIKKQRKSNA